MCGGYTYMWIYMWRRYTCVHGSLYNLIAIISPVLLSDHIVLILIPEVF